MTINQTESRYEAMADKLLLMLDKEILYADEMQHLLEDEMRALLDMDMQALVGLSRKKMDQLHRMQRLDASVQEQIDAILVCADREKEARGSELGKKTVDISSVDDLFANDSKEILLQKKELLREKRRVITDKNYINKRLVEDSLGFLNDAISLLTTRPEEPGYSKKKAGRKSVSGPAFLSRAV